MIADLLFAVHPLQLFSSFAVVARWKVASVSFFIDFINDITYLM